MNSKTGVSGRARTRRAGAATLAIGLTGGLLGCSIYDESLRQGAGVALGGAGASNGGASGAAAEGGAGVSMGGDLVDAGAPGVAGDPGELPTAGASSGGGAGDSSGGSGDSGGPVAAGGMSASGSGGQGTAGSAAQELGLGKPTTASTQQPANPSGSGNDGQSTTRWSATTAALPQWWRVDLGESHLLTQVSLRFENADRKYSYMLETSTDDTAYTVQATVDAGTGAVQVVPLPSQVSARYLRITVTATVPGVDASGNPRPTWASFWEASVLGI